MNTTEENLGVIYTNLKQFKTGTSSFIIKILEYYKSFIPKFPRYLFDSDATWFYNFDDCISKVKDEKKKQEYSERGDIMTSLWSPLTYYLKLNDSRIIAKNDFNIELVEKLLNYITKTNDKNSVINEINQYCCNYMTRGNILLLPNTLNKYNKKNMNPDKNREAEDKIDQTLFCCFDGSLSIYFKNNLDYLREWIKSENLDCMFDNKFLELEFEEIKKYKSDVRNNDIVKENIISLIGNKSFVSSYKYRDIKNNDDWFLYFNNLNKIIFYRNNQHFSSHLPFEW